MEIITQTPQRLELGYRQNDSFFTVAVATLFGLAFVGFGIWGIFTGKQKILKCVRLNPVKVECQLTTSGLIGSQTTKLANVQQADLIKRKVKGKRDRTIQKNIYDVVLIAGDRSVAVSAVSTSNYALKQADVRRINSFIGNPQQFALTMREDGRWLGLILGSILASVGGAVIYALWQIKIVNHAVFDRRLGVLRIQKRSLYGQTAKLSWNLRQIEEISLQQSDGKNTTYYSTNLKLNSEPKCLTLLRTENHESAENLAAEIRQFLNS